MMFLPKKEICWWFLVVLVNSQCFRLNDVDAVYMTGLSCHCGLLHGIL